MSYPFRDAYHRLRKSLTSKVGQLWPTVAFETATTPVTENEYSPYDVEWPKPLPAQAVEFLHSWSKLSDREAVYRVTGPCTLDPKMGIIFKQGRVVWGSSDRSQTEKNPSFLKHLQKPALCLPKAISLHHFHGDNYFHFFLYVLSKLHSAEHLGICPSAPVIVSEKTGATSFFKEAEALGLFGGRQVVRQKRKEVLRIEELYLVQSPFCRRPFFDWLCEKLELDLEPANKRRLLVLRGENAANGRALRNRGAVIDLAKKHGFEVVDPGELTLKKQAKLFSEAEVVLGQHGAGLTNLVFRRAKPTTLIELFSPTMGSPHYFMIAREKNFRYRSLMTRNPQGRDFTASTEVDLSELQHVLLQL
ncbi:uncharacterized protein DUF563 [Roseibium hamelinense]|uniref:Uncharacterized protein DUF563 n=1 Tax=Roseibium hamelinense TaxID=150831 RepID=A0A562T141_9HYPH|nr:glycosyltransferase family 61 protein [Roseibium hamelinense]MTI44707.1 glycosyltransferase family 61 protein [Roseibium hamelinense]TWI87337.1 uncharacterized protein DUF563 [Roseibium hamelinense]